MSSLHMTTTIRIKVPNQDFSAILLVVSGETTLKQVHAEVRCQLGLDPDYHPGRGYPKPERRKTCLRAQCMDTKPDPIHFMMDWTIERALENGAGDFELVFTDMCS